MIRITQVKLPLDHTEADLKIRAAKLLRIPDERVKAVHIVKQSVDARRRGEIGYSYVLDVETDREEQVAARSKNPNVSICTEKPYVFPVQGPSGQLERSRRGQIITGQHLPGGTEERSSIRRW